MKNKKLEQAAKGEPVPASPEPIIHSEGSESFYNQFLPLARKLAPDRLRRFSVDASLAHHNIVKGVQAVMPKRAEVERQLPHEDLDALFELPDISRGLLHIGARVATRDDDGRLRADLVEARALRRLLLTTADALAQAGVFKATVVAEIRKGNGAINTANDCVALADMFNRDPKALAKTALTGAQIARAAALGGSLQTRLKPGRAKGRKPLTEEMKRKRDERDRFWTLIEQRYERLWSIGALLFGYAVGEHVPSLQAGVANVSAERKAAKAQREADVAAKKAAKAAGRAASQAAAKAEKAALRAARKGGNRPAAPA